jgi:glycosyltransferase involved in cell wall biosynthesis
MIPEMLADGSNNSNKHLGERSSIIGEMDVFASISQSTADDLVKYYPDSQGRITITHLAAELPASKHHELLPDVPYFLIVGNRGGYKNGDLALRAFSKIAKEHKKLLLVYFGGESISAEEYEFLEKEKLKDRVFRIRGEDALLSSAYEKAKALLYPSNYEGFGLPLLEAFQKGCPVITCENSSLPEVGGDAAIYVDPDDADVLAMEMENLLNATADDRAKLVGKGKAQELKFTWASTAQSTLSLYKIQ